MGSEKNAVEDCPDVSFGGFRLYVVSLGGSRQLGQLVAYRGPDLENQTLPSLRYDGV